MSQGGVTARLPENMLLRLDGNMISGGKRSVKNQENGRMAGRSS